MTVQIVGYYEDASEFPHGPFVACRHPFGGNNYRIEQRAPSGVGTCFPELEKSKAVHAHFNVLLGWKTLEQITPMIEWLNAKDGKRS